MDERQTGAFWITDVGEGTREEVNFEAPDDRGHNYGWRLREGTVENPVRHELTVRCAQVAACESSRDIP